MKTMSWIAEMEASTLSNIIVGAELDVRCTRREFNDR
jgi:hypothetical protein